MTTLAHPVAPLALAHNSESQEFMGLLPYVAIRRVDLSGGNDSLIDLFTLPQGSYVIALGHRVTEVSNQANPLTVFDYNAAVAASGTITPGTEVSGETVTVGTVTYTLRTTLTVPAVANEIFIGAAATDTADNLEAAINGAAGAGTLYSTGTVAHPLVTANAVGAIVTVTARTAGTDGNLIALSEVGTSMAVSGSGFLASGSDGTAYITAGEITATTLNHTAWDAGVVSDSTPPIIASSAAIRVAARISNAPTSGEIQVFAIVVCPRDFGDFGFLAN